jgi:hypothetical protein
MIIHFPKKRIWGIGYTLLPIMALLVVGTVIGHTILTSNKAAATTTGFDPSNIISDSVMTASSTMSVDQIQSFLVGKVPICDTGGTLPATDFLGANTTVTHAQYAAQRIAAAQAAGQTTNWTLPPYACLKDYTENGLSSAQIIYNIAQQYQINPEVLIVLLQKEQGLVTDTWPLPIEYTSATGYGCPDNSVCSSQYYGFTNQVTWAAKMYHAIETSSSTWYSPYIRGNNTVYYNAGPYNSTAQMYYGRFGTSRDIQYCGSTIINIQNKATQALYDYTPYQPNQASFGSGDTCSSYGNLNFYSYFTNYFGSTQVAGACTGTELPDNYVRSFYNPNTYDHFYSAYSCDIPFLQKLGYTNEGAVFNTTPSTAPWAIPVYRYYNPTTGMHVWSTVPYSINTPQILLAGNSGYQQEAGIVFYVAQSTMPNVTPIVSFYNPRTYLHVLGPAPSQQAIDTLKAKAGYNLEGPAFSTQ